MKRNKNSVSDPNNGLEEVQGQDNVLVNAADSIVEDAVSVEQVKSEVKRMTETLTMMRGQRIEQGLQAQLIAIKGRLRDCSQEILAASAQKFANLAIRNIMVKVIDEAIDGCMAVPRYAEKSGSEQDVYVFDGIYWQLMKPQVYKDFVRDCAEIVGLQELNLNNHLFMLQLYEQLAHKLSADRSQVAEKDCTYVNLLNCTLRIRHDGEVKMLSHRREDFFRYVLPYDYDPNAECPMWQKFLDEVLPEREAQMLLAEYFGYCFIHNIKCEKMLVLYGSGSNGKSVVLDVIGEVLGAENVTYYGLRDLTVDDLKRAKIEGKLANISHESDRAIDPSVLKKLVSGEPIDVRELYIGPHIMREYAKLVTAFNILPRAEATFGFFRRFIILPFTVTISEKDADKNLAKKIVAAELPGILNWVIEGMKRFCVSGKFTESKVCDEALANYRLSSDSALMFTFECCSVSDNRASLSGKDVYSRYVGFCEDNGVKPLGKQKFIQRMDGLSLPGGKRVNLFRHGTATYFNLSFKPVES